MTAKSFYCSQTFKNAVPTYLQQSNQLFVTRILGLSGYDAGPSWSLQAIANVNGTTVGIDTGVASVPFTTTFSGFTTGNTLTFGGGLPPLVLNALNTSYTLIDGSTSTYNSDLFNFMISICNNLFILVFFSLYLKAKNF